jgi:hypothetical protein
MHKKPTIRGPLILKMSLFTVGLLFSICSFSQYTDIINSNNPGNSTSAYSVGKRVYQIESGFSVDRLRGVALQSESLFNNGNLALRVGLFSEVIELIYEGSYTMEFSTSPIPGGKIGIDQGFTSNRIGAKIMLFDPFKNPNNRPINVYSWKKNNGFRWRNILPAVALYAGANIGLESSPYLIDNPSFAPRAMIVTQSHLTPKMVLILNGIYDFIGSETLAEKTIIASLSYAIKRKWSVFVEGQYSILPNYEEQIIRTGGAFLFRKDLQFDLYTGINFQKEPSREVIGLGFSYRLDRH